MYVPCDMAGCSLECSLLHLHGPGLALKGAEDLPLLLHLPVNTGTGGRPLPLTPMALETGLTHHYTPVVRGGGGGGGEQFVCACEFHSINHLS